MGYEEKLKKFYIDDINVGDDMWLVFKREQYYLGTKQCAMSVTLMDTNTTTQTHLATYFDGQWTSPSQLNMDIFWRYVSKYRSRIKHIQTKLLQPVSETKPFQVEWNCLQRRFKLEAIKLTKSIRKSLK